MIEAEIREHSIVPFISSVFSSSGLRFAYTTGPAGCQSIAPLMINSRLIVSVLNAGVN
jgi:hypothetical protein